MGKIYTSCSSVSRPPPQKGPLIKRLFRLLDSSREYPFVWGCDPAGSGIIAICSRYIENKGSPCHWYQFEGGYRCIKTHNYNIGITALIPSQHKRKLFPTLFPEYQFDHHIFTPLFFQDYYSRLKVLSILAFDILQDTLPVADLH